MRELHALVLISVISSFVSSDGILTDVASGSRTALLTPSHRCLVSWVRANWTLISLRGGEGELNCNSTASRVIRPAFSVFPQESDSEGGQGKEASTEEEDKDRDFVLHLPGSRHSPAYQTIAPHP